MDRWLGLLHFSIRTKRIGPFQNKHGGLPSLITAYLPVVPDHKLAVALKASAGNAGPIVEHMKPLGALPAAGTPRKKHRQETELSINKGNERDVNRYRCVHYQTGDERVMGKEGGTKSEYEAKIRDRNHAIYQGELYDSS